MSDFTAQLQQALSSGYTLERELTGGGMSRVFVATDTALGRHVVVKVLPPELAAGVNHERFRREIQVAAQRNQPVNPSPKYISSSRSGIDGASAVKTPIMMWKRSRM